MLQQLRPALAGLGCFTVLLGLAYPLAMTGIAQRLFPDAANGSLVTRDGVPVGSSLIGQAFAAPIYLHPRPSAAGTGYDGTASSGTNLGPTSAKLAERLKADGAALKAETGAGLLPADAITTSGSGLDPDISPAFAALQAPRIASARRIDLREVKRIIAAGTAGRTFGLLGEPRVNVLAVNLALDAAAAPKSAPASGTPTAASAGAPAG
ncbi:potassium-transporting ATPase KdpC subunit [Aureimonas endophytica]|uniref:Potassium-transporting ATPase KdpC subunit n=1 Tax=Aureimonas endophytica TaxID=2027858 RepID=A0A917A2J9_9HYPH|nr:potassium-transporting ATPase subunit KdpC [Aureimonas endophytica]GGE23217.1 potassium-transporting ATPase KdpC subunit [Aureimonas endophytica]